MQKYSRILMVLVLLAMGVFCFISNIHVKSYQSLEQVSDKKVIAGIVDRAKNDALKELVEDYKRKAYWLELIKSFELFVSLSMNEEFLRLIESGSQSPNQAVSILNSLMKNGAAKWLLEESGSFCNLLRKNCFTNIELCVIQANIRCKHLYNRKLPELSRALIGDSDLLAQIEEAGNLEGHIKKFVSKLKGQPEHKSVLLFLLLLPSFNRESHLFASTIRISFYCTKEDKSYLKTIQFDLFLDDLKPKKVGQFQYFWRIENIKKDRVD